MYVFYRSFPLNLFPFLLLFLSTCFHCDQFLRIPFFCHFFPILPSIPLSLHTYVHAQSHWSYEKNKWDLSIRTRSKYILSALIYYIILCGFIRITLFEFTYLEQVRKICIRFSLVSHKKRDARFGLQDERNTLIIDFLKEAHLCLWQAKIEVEIVTVEPISLRIFVRRMFQKIVLRR